MIPEGNPKCACIHQTNAYIHNHNHKDAYQRLDTDALDRTELPRNEALLLAFRAPPIFIIVSIVIVAVLVIISSIIVVSVVMIDIIIISIIVSIIASSITSNSIMSMSSIAPELVRAEFEELPVLRPVSQPRASVSLSLSLSPSLP